jgi:carboxylesterase
MRGYLLIHGFAGTPADLEAVAGLIKEYGGAVACPLLPGHGGDRDLMRKAGWKDWVAASEQSLLELSSRCSKVTVIGFSMGAIIGALLGVKYSLDRLVLMSPPVLYTNPPELVKGASEAFRGRLGDNPEATEYLKEYFRRLFRAPVRSLNELHRLIKTAQPAFDRLQVPTLIMQGERDDLAHPKGAKMLYERIPAKEKKLVMLPNSRHLICNDCERDVLLREVHQFLNLS